MLRLQDEFNDMVRDYPYLSNFDVLQSRIHSGTTAVRDHRSDYRHIDFDTASATVAARLQFRSLLEKELRLRNKGIQQQMEANRIELMELLLLEQRFLLLKSILSESTLEGAMIKLEKAIPCLLHLENRISDTMITFLLRRGIQLREENREETERLIKAVQLVFNEQLFGRPGSPSNWKFPLNDDGTMGEIKLSNWRARRVVEHINELIAVCLPTEDDRNRWDNVFQSYRQVIKVCFSGFDVIHLSLYFITHLYIYIFTFE